MAKSCILCNKEIPSNADVCPICGMNQNVKLIKCKCKGYYYRGIDFCPHCSRPISNVAKKRRKNEEYLKSQKFVTEKETLERQLAEELSKNKKLIDERVEISKKNDQLEKEQSNNLENQEQAQQLPIWVYAIFSVIAVAVLVILILVISGTI